MKHIFYISGFIILFTSCGKADLVRYDFAGAWNMVSLHQEFYTNNQVDSTKDYTDLGVWLLTDNNSDTYNEMEYEMNTAWPFGFSSFLQSAGLPAEGGATFWYTDRTAQRLTVHEDLFIGSAYQIFTVNKVKRNKIEIQFVTADGTNAQYLSYKETFVLERL